MSDLTKLGYTALRKGYHAKSFSVREVLEAYMARIEANQHLNAFVTMLKDEALEAAKQADVRFQKNEARPLEGLPLAVKDIFCTKGILTTAGSKILHNFIPPYESTVTAKLQGAGCLNLGKVNMDEFAMGSSTESSYFGPSVSPWVGKENTKKKSPGGSSGGSSAAVAARLSLAALGTDTGGSIRQPAAFTGIVGLKPTYGRCSRYGIIAFASSLDQAGPMTQTLTDAALLFEHMNGHDEKDSTSAAVDPYRFDIASMGASIKGLRVGIPKEFRSEGLSPEIDAAWQEMARLLEKEGATLVDVSLPHTKYALPTYYIIAPAEASSNLSRYDGVRFGLRAEGVQNLEELYQKTRSEGFGEEVKRRILIGTYVLSAGAYEDYYLRSLQVRRLLRNEFKETFQKVDVLLTPTTPSPAFAVGEKASNPMEMYLSDVYTVSVNLAGLPGLSLPVGLTKSGLPIGMQLIGNDFREDLLFRVGHKMESHLNFVNTLHEEIA